MNSGWCCVKYPIYRDDDPGAMESDYVEIRLAEIYYSLAECKFRQGDITGAGKLLNAVRKVIILNLHGQNTFINLKGKSC